MGIKVVKMRSLLAIMIGWSSFSSALQAAPEILPPTEEAPWYQVNLVIFRQPQHLLQSEQWKTGDEVKRRLPSQVISLEQPGAEAADDMPAAQPSSADGTLQTLNEASLAENAPPELPTPFVAQVPSDEEFTKALNSLTRSPNYDILYQSSWLQPPLEEKDALSILVQAGEAYDGRYELEGTARLHVSRYLHFSSNLWLSKYVQQIEVVKPWWQESDTLDNTDPQQPGDADFTIELGQPMEFNDLSSDLNGDIGNQGSDDLSLSSLQSMDSGIAMGETITRYKSIRTGVMKESRRMRSGELHYLDHPLFGVMVKVVPYFPEAPETPTEGDEIASVQ